jgi:hypothetical protein
MITSWHSYPSIYAIGHRYLKDLLLDPVIVEEKIDGSQFSFGKFLDETGAEFLRCRSKGCQLNVDCPDKMFQKAVDTAKELFPILNLGWTYRGEYLAKPKHNTLAYERTPNKFVILFDINTAEEEYLNYEEKKLEAERLGLETVPLVHLGMVDNIELFRSFLDKQSILGGQKIEGVVVKNYNRFGKDKKALMGKFVSEAFKEVHGGEWRKNNPTSGDIINNLILKYKTPARWAKALQHLAEAGQITDSPKDIGILMKEVPVDVLKECEQEIKDELFAHAWKHISRGLSGGLPEWYKDELLKKQFETTSMKG